MEKLNHYPCTQKIVSGLLDFWDDHEKFVASRFDVANDDMLGITENIAKNILAIAGEDLTPYYEGYKWMCEAVFEEEMHFRRTGHYRLSDFESAYEQVYSKPEVMGPYMKGLLLSQVLWSNHTQVLSLFKDEFLTLPPNNGGKYLEIGPGHGFYLSAALQDLNDYEIAAWDISAQSIEETKECLSKLDVDTSKADLVVQDLFKAPKDKQYDKVVFSEILEHMEDPKAALDVLRNLLSDDGTLFLNVPVNSPAPDHISNWDTPDDLIAFVEAVGFRCAESFIIPSTGYTLDRALKYKAAITCLLFLRKA